MNRPPRRRVRPRKINVPAIKGAVMFACGIVAGLGSGVTGISARSAAAPMIDFLLGFTPQRTAGTSIAFALVAAASASLGASRAGLHADPGSALLLAAAATGGALFIAYFAARSIVLSRKAKAESEQDPGPEPVMEAPAISPRMVLVRRIGLSLTMLIAVYALGAAVRGGALGPRPLDAPFFQTVSGTFLIGVVGGALSGLFGITSGALLVPMLVFLAAWGVGRAIAVSLLVVAIASLIPAVMQAASKHVDARIGPWMLLGGGIGGFAGGHLLAVLSAALSPIPLAAFALVAMFLCAAALYRLS